MNRLTPCHLMVLALFAAPLAAQQDTSAYTGTEVMVPMRDGVKLHTIFYVPKNAPGKLPIILTRTPYGIDHRLAGNLRGYYAALAKDGYIFAYQDIRGRYGSEGTFVMQRPPLHVTDKKAVDESTDAWDTIDWLVKHVPGNSGRVGMLGISYPGWTTAMALIDPHPALRAASPQASPADMWMGDDFHHQGAFRLSYGFEYAVLTEASDTNSDFSFDRYDTYDWYRELGPLSHVNDSILHGIAPHLERFRGAPELRRLLAAAGHGAVPHQGDRADAQRGRLVGPGRLLRADPHLSRRWNRSDTKHLSRLVVGPWNHGGWAERSGTEAGQHRFRQPHRRVLPRQRAGALLRLLPEGPGGNEPARGAHLGVRRQPVGAERCVARQGRGAAEAALLPGRRPAFIRRPGGVSRQR